MKLKYPIYCVLLLACIFVLRGCGVIWNPFSRYDQLKSVVDRHVGYAHATRGMNMFTIEALRHAVRQEDLPLLAQMLDDNDRIAAMTAAEVLGGMGEEGEEVLRKCLRKLSRDKFHSRTMLQSIIEDALNRKK